MRTALVEIHVAARERRCDGAHRSGICAAPDLPDIDGTAVRRSRPRLANNALADVPDILRVRYGTPIAHPVHGVRTPGKGVCHEATYVHPGPW